MTPAREIVGKAGGGAVGTGAPERAEPPAGQGPRLFQLGLGGERGQGSVDERGGHASRPQLGPQAGGPVPPARAPLHPAERERGVVEVSALREVGDDPVGDVGRRAPSDQATAQVGARPRAPGKKIGRRQAGGGQGQRAAGSGYRFRNGLAPGVGAGPGPAPGAPGAGFFWSPSNVNSPVEKMPRTLRSKSSALVAASRAVS